MRHVAVLSSLLSLPLALAACGDSASEPDPAPVTVPVSVVVSGDGTGSVTSSPPGLTCEAGPGDVTCEADFESGTPVTLTASSSGSSLFEGWSGACQGTGTCAFTAATGVSATASFDDPTRAETVVGPEGGTATSPSGDVTLTIPAGALSGDEFITVDEIGAAGLGAEFARVLGEVERAWEMGPDGLTFDEPVEVRVLIEGGASDPDSIPIRLLLTADRGAVSPLETIRIVPDGSDLVVTGRLRHFSPVAETHPDFSWFGTDKPPGATYGENHKVEYGSVRSLLVGDDRPTYDETSFEDESEAPLELEGSEETERTETMDGREVSVLESIRSYVCSGVGVGAIVVRGLLWSSEEPERRVEVGPVRTEVECVEEEEAPPVPVRFDPGSVENSGGVVPSGEQDVDLIDTGGTRVGSVPVGFGDPAFVGSDPDRFGLGQNGSLGLGLGEADLPDGYPAGGGLEVRLCGVENAGESEVEVSRFDASGAELTRETISVFDSCRLLEGAYRVALRMLSAGFLDLTLGLAPAGGFEAGAR